MTQTIYKIENNQGPIAVIESSKNVAGVVASLYDNATYKRINRDEARKIRTTLMERKEKIIGKYYEGETALERMIDSCA